jgi:hypothetical protein
MSDDGTQVEDTVEPSTGQANQQSSEASDTGDQTDWKSLAEQAQAEIEQWKALARKHEDRAKRNYEAATKVKEAESKVSPSRSSFPSCARPWPTAT